MQERVDEEDEADNPFISQDASNAALKPSNNAYSQHAQPAAPVLHKYKVPKSPSASLTGSYCLGRHTSIHPLRMHPPSPSLSLSARSIASQSQDTSSLSQSPRKILLPSTPSFDDAASKASRETISTRHSRRMLPELNIKVANSDIKAHEEDLGHNDRKQTGVAQGDAGPTDKHSSLPRDVGYVEAMRLWYEEKENDASENRHRNCKATRRAGSAGCALASVNANHRL